MCGIIGYVGKSKAAPILIEGLKRLEYRGYDSAGFCTINDNQTIVEKDVGKIEEVDTKINFLAIFKSTKDAFDAAGIEYPREEKRKLMMRSGKEKREQIINLIKRNPLFNVKDIIRITKTQPYHLFKNMGEIYMEAGIKIVGRTEKWKLKKRKEVIDFIKENPLAT